jgi:molybdate transport system substrate-binding protein
MARAVLLALVVGLLGGCGRSDPGRPAPLLVFAAASLTDAVTEVAGDYERLTGRSVRLSFGGSSALARQIVAGAPADVFLSANPTWVDHVVAEGRARAEDRSVFATGRLTVVMARGRPAPGSLVDLAALGRIALADPESVPAGIYARRMLEKAGVWPAITSKVIPALDVRAALALAQSGAVDAAVVYATDARRAPELTEARIVPDRLQPEIRYVAVITEHGGRAYGATNEFIGALVSEIGGRRLVAHGFEPVEGGRP